MLQPKKNPWTILDKKEIYDNPWIKLTHHNVLTPSNTNGIYATVHFKHLAIGIIPLTENMETYLVGQYRFPLEQYSWEIPMGGGNLESNVLDSAKRELQEEVGLLANSWKEILKIHTSNSVCDETGFVYVAKNLALTNSAPDETEELTIKKLPFEDAVSMVMNGEITDSLSIAGILKLKLMLDQGFQ